MLPQQRKIAKHVSNQIKLHSYLHNTKDAFTGTWNHKKDPCRFNLKWTVHRGFHVDAATQTLQQQLNDSWNMTLIIANELPPILSKPQSNQESTRLSGTGCAVEAVRLRKPWSTWLPLLLLSGWILGLIVKSSHLLCVLAWVSLGSSGLSSHQKLASFTCDGALDYSTGLQLQMVPRLCSSEISGWIKCREWVSLLGSIKQILSQRIQF